MQLYNNVSNIAQSTSQATFILIIMHLVSMQEALVKLEHTLNSHNNAILIL